MASTTRTLHIVYNADSTIMGKLRYGYSKWQSKPSDSEPTCAACDITHGGLSLSETKAWKQAKEEITAQDPHLRVVQWHRDEMNPQLKDFVKSNGIRYPSALLEEGSKGFRCVVSNEELATLHGDAQGFVTMLKQKGVLSEKTQAAL